MRVIGLGLSSAATRDDLRAALAAAGPADALAVLQSRADHPALADLTLTALPETAIRGIATPTRSPRILACFGCGSVAEALAVAACGGMLTHPRQIQGGVTWAVAETLPTAQGPHP